MPPRPEKLVHRTTGHSVPERARASYRLKSQKKSHCIFLQGSNAESLGRLLVKNDDYDEDFLPPMLLRGSKVWAHICERILAACQKWTRPRLNAMSVLMSSGPPPKYHPQPVGQPRKGYKWNRTTGTWDRDVGDAVEDGGSRKRPVGAPPKGNK